MASTTEANRALVERYTEHGFKEVLKGNVDAVHEYLHDHYVRHTGNKHDRGAKDLQSVKAGLANIAGAFSDARHRVDHIVADGDLVMVHWHLEGKHTGRHRHHHADGHVEATGENALVSGISLYRVQDGKIAESWSYDNHTDFLIGSGALEVGKKG
jgi:predicted SnoaL-like aldol condensation-catalyzing enzyme